MPALNFKKQFAEMVESGRKRQTIRSLRKDGRNPRVGQTLYLYMGMRTKYCKKLGEAVCKSVKQMTIETNEAIVGVDFLDITQQEKLAKADGFNSFVDMIDFFRKTHGLPFYGLLIKW
jgi:hypothetical protein